MIEILSNPQVWIIIGLFILSFVLIRINFLSSLVLALILSGFLHKELFSMYIWDVLPIRVFMGAFLISSLYDFLKFNKLSLKFLPYLKDPFIVINILLVTSKLLSMVNSLSINHSLFLNLFFITITVFIITVYIKVSGSDLIKLFKNYVVYGVILSLITFVQLYAYYQYSLLFGAILNIAGGTIDFPSFQPTYEFFTEALKIIVMTRVGSIFWDVNHFGGFLAGMLLPCFVFFVNAKSRKERILYFISFMIFVITLFLTNSRSAWLFAGVSVLIFGLIAFYFKFGKKGVVISLVTLSIVSGILLLMYQDRDSLFRAKVKSYLHYRLDSFDSHMLLLEGAVQVFEAYPLLGGGTGSFFEHFKNTSVSDEFLKRDPAGLTVRVPAHSIWGEYMSENGAFGLFSFSLLVIFMLSVYIFALSHNKNFGDYLLIASFLATNLGFLVAGVFYSYNSEFFYILFLFPLIITLKHYKVTFDNILQYYHQKSIYTFALIFLICSALILFNLGNHKLIPYDEAIYAKVAKNVYESGDYLSLYWRNLQTNWFEKPPLYFALVALSFNVFGVSEFSAKFVSALFAILSLIVVYIFGKNLKDSTTGYISMFVLTLNTSYLYYSRMAMLDVTLTFFILLGVYFFHKGFISEKKKYYAYSGVSLGFAVLTKSLVGVLPLIAFGIFGLFLIFTKKSSIKSQFQNLAIVFSTLLLISVPWHIYMYQIYGQDFLKTYFGYHLFERFATEIEDKGEVWYWYYVVIRNTMRIWFVTLILGLGLILYKFYKDKLSKQNFNYILILLVGLVIFIAFSASSSKLKWYIIPIYPFAALIVGFLVSEIKSLVEVKSKSLVLGFLLQVFIIIFGLGYFYTVRDQIYTSDLTYRIVSLIEVNNTLNNKDFVKSYFDKVEEPLSLFYSEKKYETVLWVALRDKVLEFYISPQTGYITFITSQSRTRDLKELGFPVEIVSQNEDFVLGRVSK